jgi:hypothetical protein
MMADLMLVEACGILGSPWIADRELVRIQDLFPLGNCSISKRSGLGVPTGANSGH